MFNYVAGKLGMHYIYVSSWGGMLKYVVDFADPIIFLHYFLLSDCVLHFKLILDFGVILGTVHV